MSKVFLVFNPNSDKGHSGQKAADLRGLVENLGGAEWRGTEHPGHATELAAEAALHGYDTIVALGGDGTVHEVVNGLMKIDVLQRPRLGVVPIGSGNDFASGMGVTFDLHEAVGRVFHGTPRPVDLGLLRDGAGRLEYFDNSCGMGFDADVNIRSRAITNLQGFTMYLAATLQTIFLHHNPIPMRLQFDDTRLEQSVLMLTVGNGPREGGGFMTTPAAKLDDGLLDYVWIQDVSRLRMLQLVPKVMNATHVRERDVHLGQFHRLVIDAESAIPIHLDGELIAPYEANVRHVEITVVPSAIQLML